MAPVDPLRGSVGVGFHDPPALPGAIDIERLRRSGGCDTGDHIGSALQRRFSKRLYIRLIVDCDIERLGRSGVCRVTI